MNNIEVIQNLGQALKVLYVEDDLALQKSFAKYLDKIFNEVEIASDGEEGLALFKQGTFDIVITDISMPKMSGLDMARKMKEINADQEIIVVSAYTEIVHFMESIEIGVSGYIVKPVEFTQINDVLYKTVYKLHVINDNMNYKQHLEVLVEKRTTEKHQLELDKIDNYEKTLHSMVDLIEQRDTYTGGHSQRVANYSHMIAKAMGFSEEKCTLIYRAGILHDIGKLATPDAVLLKPGSLNKLEFKLIQEHVVVGSEMLHKIPMYQELSKIIQHHHERCDGTGYPKGLSEGEIPPLARIMIVADAFDAMTTNRIYKGRKSVKDALVEIEQLKNKQFHPEVVEVAVSVLKDVNIDDTTNQEPFTDLEKERFAYYYKDQLTDLFNRNYLDMTLTRNNYEHLYQKLHIIFLNHFSQYNENHGWSSGDKFLELFSKHLKEIYEGADIFRIHGDDFVVISEDDTVLSFDALDRLDMFKNCEVSVTTMSINIDSNEIKNLEALEMYLH